MNLNNRATADPRWIQHVQNPLDGFLNCEIQLLDMNLREDDGRNFDWKTNTGSSATPDILYAGVAQLQVYRFTLTMDAPVGSVDQVRNVRFTLPRKVGLDLDIRKGMQIAVTSCENDPSLTRYQYVVNSGLNSGWGFRRTIETEVDMARII